MSEPSGEMPQSRPRTFIEGGPDHIEAVYNLARAGVQIEYAGITGRELYEIAAVDLYNLGALGSHERLTGIYREALDEHVDQPEDIVKAFFATRAAMLLIEFGEVEEGYDEYFSAYSSLVSLVGEGERLPQEAIRGKFSSLSLGRDLIAGAIALDVLDERTDPEHFSPVLDKGFFLGYEGIMKYLRGVVQTSGIPSHLTPYEAFNAAEELFDEAAVWFGDELPNECVSLIMDIYEDAVLSRCDARDIIGVRALAVLRNVFPDDKYYKKRAVVLGLPYILRTAFGKNGYSTETHTHIKSALRGTWLDLAVLDEVREIQVASANAGIPAFANET